MQNGLPVDVLLGYYNKVKTNLTTYFFENLQ